MFVSRKVDPAAALRRHSTTRPGYWKYERLSGGLGQFGWYHGSYWCYSRPFVGRELFYGRRVLSLFRDRRGVEGCRRDALSSGHRNAPCRTRAEAEKRRWQMQPHPEPQATTTKLLYHDDSYLRTFEANVVSVEGAALALSQTAFFPGGGGQMADRGALLWN